MSMSEWTNVPAEVRQNYACKVCGNYPDEEGVLDHGRGCYMLDENGGGSEYIDPPEHLPQHATPAPLKPLANVPKMPDWIADLIFRTERIWESSPGCACYKVNRYGEDATGNPVFCFDDDCLRSLVDYLRGLFERFKSHGLPDGAEPGEWIAERLAKLHAIEEEATGEAAGNDMDGVEPHRVLEILVETRQALAAAEARAEEAERGARAWEALMSGIEAIRDTAADPDFTPDQHLNAYIDAWRRQKDALTAAEARIVELEGELDPAICRLQFPDGSVPGNVLECAEGWKRWYEQTSDRIAELRRERDAQYERAEREHWRNREEEGKWLVTRDANVRITAELTALQAKLAGLAGEIRGCEPEGRTTVENYWFCAGLTRAADLVADAVAERCEENTNG
jgi:hypothetical protein